MQVGKLPNAQRNSWPLPDEWGQVEVAWSLTLRTNGRNSRLYQDPHPPETRGIIHSMHVTTQRLKWMKCVLVLCGIRVTCTRSWFNHLFGYSSTKNQSFGWISLSKLVKPVYVYIFGPSAPNLFLWASVATLNDDHDVHLLLKRKRGNSGPGENESTWFIFPCGRVFEGVILTRPWPHSFGLFKTICKMEVEHFPGALVTVGEICGRAGSWRFICRQNSRSTRLRDICSSWVNVFWLFTNALGPSFHQKYSDGAGLDRINVGKICSGSWTDEGA